MNNQEYILAGIELADGWHTFEHAVEFLEVVKTYHGFGGPDSDKEIIDALAAQLVRQVDAIDGKFFFSNGVGKASVHSNAFDIKISDRKNSCEISTLGPDRTMNTIKAIVDSEVLK